MEKIWTTLVKEAKNKIYTKEIPPFINYGNNACALITSENNIYTGISINSNSNIGCTCEKSAIINMLNNNETKIEKIVILNELEELIKPSIDCYDYLLELNPDMEILIDNQIFLLKDILPDWYGTYYIQK